MTPSAPVYPPARAAPTEALLHCLHAVAERARSVTAACRAVINAHPFIDSVAAIMRALTQPPATVPAVAPVER